MELEKVYHAERIILGTDCVSDRKSLVERLKKTTLYLVTDDRLSQPEMLERLEQSLEAGVRVVQFRAKALERREFLRRAEEVQSACRRHGALFIVNDAADVAALCGADGLHVGQTDLPAGRARQIVGNDMLLGVSASALDLARAAAADPAVDYLGVGAIYPTDTKPNATFRGLELLRTVRAAVDLPLVAIGGITPERASATLQAGADMLAVVTAVFAAPDVGRATRGLLAPGPGVS